MRKFYLAVVCASFLCPLALAGCGGSGGGGEPAAPVAEENMTTSKAELKQRLEEIASTGVAGSGLAGMQESLDALKATDAALAEELQKSLDQLQSATSPAKVKSLASGMAAKL